MPHERVAGGFARGPGPHDITGKNDAMPFLTELADGFDPSGKTRLAHGEGMKRNIRPAPGMLGRGKIIGVDFAFDFEDPAFDSIGKIRTGKKPLSIRPGLENAFRPRVRPGFFDDGVKGAVDQNDVFQGRGRILSKLFVFEKRDERFDVCSAEHRPEKKNGLLFRDRRRVLIPAGHGSQPFGLDPGGGIDTGRNPVPQQAEEQGFAARFGFFEPAANFSRLFRVQGKGRDPKAAAFGFVLKIGFQHQ